MALYQAGGGLNAEAIARLRGRQAGHTLNCFDSFQSIMARLCVCFSIFLNMFKSLLLMNYLWEQIDLVSGTVNIVYHQSL